uniref:Uncharacterized protein n=1 Tax=Arundo donax TaxID=35708 RepID=A0A0A9AYL8_ARUDO
MLRAVSKKNIKMWEECLSHIEFLIIVRCILLQRCAYLRLFMVWCLVFLLI